MIMYGSKEQTKSDFKKKPKEVDCHQKQIEQYSPWQNTAEGVTPELKKGASQKIIQTDSPKRVWDHCLELKACIRSCTAHDIYIFDDETLEAVIEGETSNISQISKFEWYKWVMFFRDTQAQFPDRKMVLVRYLGPGIDVGPAMTAEIMISNGYVDFRSTL